MKLKYYLRGLGIGMVVTALLMGASEDKQVSAKGTASVETEQTTEQYNQQVETEPVVALNTEEEEIVSSQIQIQEESTNEEETEQNMEMEAEPVTESEIENITDDVQVETEDHTEQESEEEESTEELPKEVKELLEMTKNASSYTLEIVRGDDSGTVSRKLQNAGLIENASEFDAFLMQHGYDKKISIGTVVIPKDASWVEIAEKLAGK